MNTMVKVETSFGKELAKEFERLERFVAASVEEKTRVDCFERDLFAQVLQLGFKILQTFVAASGDGNQGKVLEQNGRVLKRMKRSRRYRSIFGVLKIKRFVYAAGEHKKVEVAPLDERLGLPKGEQSYVLEDWACRLTSHMAYPEAVTWLQDVLKIGSSVRAAELMARKVSAHVPDFRADRPTVPLKEGCILALTSDAIGVPIRRPLEQRIRDELGRKPHKRHSSVTYQKAKKRRHRGDKKVRKQMATVGAVYSIDRWVRTPLDVLRETTGKPEPDRPRPQDKRLCAEMTQVLEGTVSRGAERVFEQLVKEVDERDPDHQCDVVLVVDGDPSLWNLKRKHLPNATGVLDIYHVIEKLWKAAYCFHPESSADAEDFVNRYLLMILEGRVGNVIGVFRRFLKQRSLKAVKKTHLNDVIRYFDTNREGMRYHEYLAAGYPIGSGVVEGACRHVVADRLRRTGMRWEIEGAQAILDLRTTELNGEWENFIERRIQNEQSALYSKAA